jgi:type IV secretion system protein VirB1
MLPPALFAPLAVACAPQVAPGTLAVAESGLDPLAIRDNTAHMVWRLRDLRKELLLAEDLIGAGHRLDVGLMQLDSARTILVRDVLGPCGWR